MENKYSIAKNENFSNLYGLHIQYGNLPENLPPHDGLFSNSWDIVGFCLGDVIHAALNLTLLMVYQQLNKLTLADDSVPIFVHRLEHPLDLLPALYLIFKEFHHLLESYLATVVDVEVGEGLLEMFFGYFFGKINRGDQKLRIIDMA